MLNSRAGTILILLLLLLVAAPAAATIINTTSLVSNYGTDFDESITGQDYVYTAPAGQLVDGFDLDEGTFTSDRIVTFTFILNDGSEITGTIEKHATGAFSGETTISINGGSSKTFQYTRVGTVDLSQAIAFVIVQETNSTSNFYLAGGDYFDMGLAGLYSTLGWTWTWDINTDTDAYLPITDPSTNPIVSVAFTSDQAEVDYTVYHETFEALGHVKEFASTGKVSSVDKQTEDWTAIIQYVLDAIPRIIQAAAGLLAMVLSGALFILAAKTIIVIFVLYTAIAIFLSIEKTEDMFVAARNFVRYEMKLLRFFMELFLYLKELIKWW